MDQPNTPSTRRRRPQPDTPSPPERRVRLCRPPKTGRGRGWMELAVDQTVGRLNTRNPADCAKTAAAPAYPFDPGLTHQPFHPLAGDRNVPAQSELGPDPW